MLINNKLSLIFFHIEKFGFINGLIICLKIYFRLLSKIKIPNIKFSFKLRPNTTDVRIFWQFFLEEQYNIKINFTPEYIIDAGANIGLFSIFMKNKFPNSKIICIEPDEKNFAILNENTKKYDNIFLEKKGLWNKNAVLKISNMSDSNCSGLVVEENNNGNIESINMKNLIDNYNMNCIDILKIDIEGSEKEIFNDNPDWLTKVKILIIELHDDKKSGCAFTFFNALQTYIPNYRLEVIGTNIVIYSNLYAIN